MLKKILSMTIVMLVMNWAIAPSVFASDTPEKEAKFAEKVKAEISKIGSGPDAKVRVKLKDGTKLEGYVSEIKADSFTVVDKKSGNATSVPYPNVKQVKGNNLSDGVVIALVFVALIGVTIIGAVVKSRKKTTF